MNGRLWLVGTPIGNLGDISDRARSTLAAVDLIAAEDTRRTGRLLKSIGVDRPMVSYFEGNERQRVPELIARLSAGASVALVTDGGMPAVSDPGFRLVRQCVASGIPIEVVPGPSSVLTALVVSGLPTDRFCFEGFLPRAKGDRDRRWRQLADETRTMVFFESPLRTVAFLRDALERLGDRDVAVCRELTKLHEETLRGKTSEVLEELEDRSLKGEVVIVLGGKPAGLVSPAEALEEAVTEANRLVAGGMKKREAARLATESTSISVNEVYQLLT